MNVTKAREAIWYLCNWMIISLQVAWSNDMMKLSCQYVRRFSFAKTVRAWQGAFSLLQAKCEWNLDQHNKNMSKHIHPIIIILLACPWLDFLKPSRKRSLWRDNKATSCYEVRWKIIGQGHISYYTILKWQRRKISVRVNIRGLFKCWIWLTLNIFRSWI